MNVNVTVLGILFASASVRPESARGAANEPFLKAAENFDVCAATTPFLALIEILIESLPVFTLPLDERIRDFATPLTSKYTFEFSTTKFAGTSSVPEKEIESLPGFAKFILIAALVTISA